MHARSGLLAATAMALSSSAALAEEPVQLARADVPALESVVVTARYRPEDAQAVPISLSVIDSKMLDTTSTYNTSLMSQLVPSLNYNSPNPRNTSFTIRGLGSS